MPEFGDKHGFLNRQGPSVRPFRVETDTDLVESSDQRLKKDSLSCDNFRPDDKELRRVERPFFNLTFMVPEESLRRENNLTTINKSMKDRGGLLDMLQHPSHSLGLALAPHEIIQKEREKNPAETRRLDGADD